jgi:hypothetical protein
MSPHARLPANLKFKSKVADPSYLRRGGCSFTIGSVSQSRYALRKIEDHMDDPEHLDMGGA